MASAPNSKDKPGRPADRPGRLTEAEKKENHIRSEKKRREAIREGYSRLASIVPGLEGQGRSESVVIEGTLELMRTRIEKRMELLVIAKEKGLDVSKYELEPHTIAAYHSQKKRNAEEQAQKRNAAEQGHPVADKKD